MKLEKDSGLDLCFKQKKRHNEQQFNLKKIEKKHGDL